MPKLWTNTIEAHKQSVRDAALDAAASLVLRRGLAAVTMSEIAQETGIGRATLYKYFPDVQALVRAWHERQIGRHLTTLVAIAHGQGPPLNRLDAVLRAYAGMAHSHQEGELASMLHAGGHAAHALDHLSTFVSSIITEGVAAGEVREDVRAKELATFCLAAMSGARGLGSDAAVVRLVALTLDALRPGSSTGGSEGTKRAP
ncbi:MAG: TetR/AcrR family transcriptional regulator [Kaiparowitsia implicata GSE-PSE-MK54-09C]|jgi:AcrR family transcriptional regulator|nr:TetR/AcrR family transcriptional regulator [Kaiparowitsia implicata GSE-PSE-MK54-09C]